MQVLLTLASILVGLTPVLAASSNPTAKTVNGTYEGVHIASYNQDAFLGIPYAQPPLGPLRFRWPRSLDKSFSGTKSAKAYGYSCYQYGSHFNLSEDCLTLNVVRPSGYEHAALPVLVWIYGGGLFAGSSADPSYNLSGIVHVSQQIGKPIVAVSINYRLGMWGFLQSPEIVAEGSSNAGLLDQRMAFRWLQENVAAFGGDPSKVTIWGESAGAQSIGYQLFSYAGRNDGLFRGAIMESGGPEGTSVQDLVYYLPPYENLTRTVGCWTAVDQLACLRNLSSAELFASHPSQVWNPLIDGDFLPSYPSQVIDKGEFIKTPLLIGANSDEGTSFSIPSVDNDTSLFQNLLTWRGYGLSPPTIRKLMELYPNDNTSPKPPYHVPPDVVFPQLGLEWRRTAWMGGDMVMIGQRRKMCEAYTSYGVDIYSYRFDTTPFNVSNSTGAAHGTNVAFSFQNVSGTLGPLPQYENYRELSQGIGRAYINFAYSQNPNGGSSGSGYGSGSSGVAQLPYWPLYDLGKPEEIVLNANKTYVESDTYRKEQIDFINQEMVWRELLA
ncbi:alpha/beta-hydrolase [Rhizodiscina lignyota]|uniref:Carboxylic ester hydrolase n=1 Tax=Rhizodiscina lignyota TaxID=1504668 RepID=A0A9P4IJU1_9PEZI|nr:alpha/beta-hydrolase [Rhizodiscina lignyota]